MAHNDLFLELNGMVETSSGIGLFGVGQEIKNVLVEHNKVSWFAPNMSGQFASILLVDFTGSADNVTNNIVRKNDLRGSGNVNGPIGVTLINVSEASNVLEKNKCDLPVVDECNGL